MGLTVSAFEHATPVRGHDLRWNCKRHTMARVISLRHAYSLRGLEAGRCYAMSGDNLSFDVSYHRYGAWREALSQRALGLRAIDVISDPAKYFWETPFFELICFADNEGTIGPDAAADLAADFRNMRMKVVGQPFGDDVERTGFIELYDRFASAFDLAAKGRGMVVFW